MFNYEGTLYRPPSEAHSLIIQVTIGCAHNTCTFCSMYKKKTFRIRKEEEILAELITAMKPEFCSFLTLRLYKGTPMYDDLVSGRFERINDREVLEEMILFLENVDSEGTVFRSNHASNYLPLAGTLNWDIPQLLSAVRYALECGYRRPFREYGDL